MPAIENRLLDLIRSSAASRLVDAAQTGDIHGLRGRKYCVLVTYKKDGTGVPSPLWFGVADGKVYAHTGGVKIKRIERDPRSLVAPCTFRGRPVGPPFAGTARVVPAEEQAAAERAIAANYGWSRRAYYRFAGQADQGVYLDVTPKS
jgi:PPOX class probable F420-dependent enzyme